MSKKRNQIIIVTTVIIIIFVLAIVSIIILLGNKDQEYANKILENITINDKEQEENDKILQNDNITIIENNNETLNRKFGKVEIVWIDEKNNVIDNPLSPNLGGMKPVKFNTRSSQFEEIQDVDNNWYNYAEQRWANAKSEDGSYFVWIPRFAYRIVYYSNNQYTKTIGYCDGRGITKINEDRKLDKNNS